MSEADLSRSYKQLGRASIAIPLQSPTLPTAFDSALRLVCGGGNLEAGEP